MVEAGIVGFSSSLLLVGKQRKRIDMWRLPLGRLGLHVFRIAGFRDAECDPCSRADGWVIVVTALYLSLF